MIRDRVRRSDRGDDRATSGIGRCVAVAFARKGANLHLIGRDLGKLARFRGASTVRANDRRACSTIDLSKRIRGRRGAYDETCSPVDILVHSAGVIVPNSFSGTTEAELDLQYRVNVAAPFVLTQATVAVDSQAARPDRVREFERLHSKAAGASGGVRGEQVGIDGCCRRSESRSESRWRARHEHLSGQDGDTDAGAPVQFEHRVYDGEQLLQPGGRGKAVNGSRRTVITSHGGGHRHSRPAGEECVESLTHARARSERYCTMTR